MSIPSKFLGFLSINFIGLNEKEGLRERKKYTTRGATQNIMFIKTFFFPNNKTKLARKNVCLVNKDFESASLSLSSSWGNYI